MCIRDRDSTPQRALAGMMAKHIISIYDMCFTDRKTFELAVWEEKITDSLKMCIRDRASSAAPQSSSGETQAAPSTTPAPSPSANNASSSSSHSESSQAAGTPSTSQAETEASSESPAAVSYTHLDVYKRQC